MPEPKFIWFRSISDLVLALHLCDQEPTFPADVLRSRGRNPRWGVPAARLGAPAEFKRRAEQHGWKWEVRSPRPDDTRVPLHQALRGPWRRRDPILARRRSHTHYILAAAPGRAQNLLDALMAAVTADVLAVPVPYESRGPTVPYEFLWEVEMRHPVFSVLDQAERVWTGPIVAGAVEIFEEWPYHAEIPVELLARVDFGEGTQTVLLSREAPEVLLLARSDGAPLYSPLIDVTSLSADPGQAVRVDAGGESAIAAPTPLRVDVKLVNESRQKRVDRVANHLRVEIAFREHLLAQLRWHNDVVRDDFDPEPLYLYAQEPDRPLPAELSRLVVEWSDQPDDLGSVRYQKVAKGSFPPVVAEPSADVHVVTTASALAGLPIQGLGVRLRPYRPDRGRFVSFHVLPEWQAFGLRVFVPADQSLELFPSLAPGPTAAAKLAIALGLSPVAEWAALLIPGERGRVRPILLHLPDMRPLLGAFDWDCRLDAAVGLTAATRVSASAAERMRSTLEEQFERVVREGAMERLNVTVTATDDQVNAWVSTLADLDKELTGAGGDLEKLQAQAAHLRRLDQRAAAKAVDLDKISGELQGLIADLRQMRARFEDQQALADRIATRRREAEDGTQRRRRGR